MPVCPICQRWIEHGVVCVVCGQVEPEMTMVEQRKPPVASPQSTLEPQGSDVDAITSKSSLAEPLTPRNRHPVARLIALDDDSETDGEVWRLRSAETTIGRRGADVSIANDADISSLHAKIERTSLSDGGSLWHLVDLESTNGTFLRTPILALRSAETLKIGGVLCRWQQRHPSESRLVIAGPPERVFRVRSNTGIVVGRDPEFAQIVMDDPTIEPCHAILRQSGGQWLLEDRDSRNGIWHRITRAELHCESSFLLGEQRFRFQIPLVPNRSVRQGDAR